MCTVCTYKIIYIFLSYSSKNNWTRMFFGSWQWHMLYRARYWSRGMLLHHRLVQRWCPHSLKHPGYLWHHPGIAPSIELLLTCHLICLQKNVQFTPQNVFSILSQIIAWIWKKHSLCVEEKNIDFKNRVKFMKKNSCCYNYHDISMTK